MRPEPARARFRTTAPSTATPRPWRAASRDLELLTPAEYDRINALGDRLRDGINALGPELGLPVCATGVGSLLNIHLQERPPRNHRDVAPEQGGGQLLHLALLNEGLFPAGRGLMATSTPMDEAIVDEVLERTRRAVLAVHAERPLGALSAV